MSRSDFRVVAFALAVACVLWLPVRVEARAMSARDRYEQAMTLDQEARAAGEREGDGGTSGVSSARRALALYESVVRRFPTSGYCDNALLRGGELARWVYTRSGRASDKAAAAKYFAWLLREYPGSGLRAQARTAARALETQADVEPVRRTANTSATAPVTTAPAPPAAMAAPTPTAPAPAASAASAPSSSAPAASAAPAPVLRAIDRALVGGMVRITLVVDRETRFAHEVIDGPRRAFIDLFGVQPSAELKDAALRYDGDAVRQVRVGRRPNATRVVLDLDGAPAVSVFTLYNPFRIVIDAERPRLAVNAPMAPRPSTPVSAPAPAVMPPPSVPAAAPVVLAVLDDAVPAAPRDENDVVPADVVPSLVSDVPYDELAPANRASVSAAGVSAAAVTPAPVAPAPAVVAPVAPVPVASVPVRAARRASSPAIPTPVPAPVREPVPSTATAELDADVALTAPVPSEPAANRDGSFSLARQLGLGISRIVIDPGHGGHDPGTLTSGSNEAKLVLDVALRLEKLLAKEPGLDVVLTRRTDVFIPLEQRTAIANREGADLFLSIHANASRDPNARGLETYFLSFASNPEAEAVAARENAASANDMHNLPSIVRAIALNNKLDESRDLAGTVQQTLATRLAKSNPGVRSRGVKKAPFVVLIGAGMPSVLAEIGFITNKQEVALIKTPAYRQKIAEALHAAVLQYRRALKRQTAVATR